MLDGPTTALDQTEPIPSVALTIIYMDKDIILQKPQSGEEQDDKNNFIPGIEPGQIRSIATQPGLVAVLIDNGSIPSEAI